MQVLDLFSGIGGFSIGLERAGMTTAAFCEIDKGTRELLRQAWPNVPIFEDVRELNNRSLYESGVGAIDVICGGFPCQDISSAWDGLGLAGKRSGLWFEYARIIGEVQPRFVILENVANLRKRGLAIVLNDLACMGYNADYGIIPASAVGAPHQRERLWTTAWREWEPVVFSAECVDEDTGEESFCRHCRGDFGECDCIGPSTADDNGWECVEENWGFVAYPHGAGWGEQLRPLSVLPEHLSAECYRWYQHEPPVGRVADGIPRRSYSIQKLGNAVVPFIPELIGRAIVANVASAL